MLEGTAVDFMPAFSEMSGMVKNSYTNRVEAPIINSSEYDNDRYIAVAVARSTDEIQSLFYDLSLEKYDGQGDVANLDLIEKYDDSFFNEKALILVSQIYSVRLSGAEITELSKSENELCVSLLTPVQRPSLDAYATAITNECVAIEVNKSDLRGIDTISFYVQAKN